MRHEDVQDITDYLHCPAFQKLRSALHVQRLPLVFPLEKDHSDLGQVPQDSEDVLKQVGPHTAGVVDCNVILADDFQLSQEDTVIGEEEEYGAYILQDSQQFESNPSRRLLLEQLRDILADLRSVLDGAEETEDLTRPAHLHVDVVSGGLGSVVLGVDGGVLHQPQDLDSGGSTLSLLSVLLSRSRKVFRYCIKVDN